MRSQPEGSIVKRLVLAVALCTAALLVLVAPAGARDRAHVSGTYAVTDVGSDDCAANGSPFIIRCTTSDFISVYSGSLTGRSVSNFESIINCKQSSVHGHGTETFDGSVEGAGSGTLTWRIHFDAAFDCSTFTLSDFSGRGVIIAGTGALAGRAGHLQFGDVTYDGELH